MARRKAITVTVPSELRSLVAAALTREAARLEGSVARHPAREFMGGVIDAAVQLRTLAQEIDG